MQGVSKRYGGVRALEDAALVIEAGRIHAVLGENGAGKSTLIKIMSGVVLPDEGRMLLDGHPVSFASPAAAHAAGIACIFQELSLIPDLSVADNIAISNPPCRYGLIDRRAQRRMAEDALARAGADNIHPLALVKDLSLSRRQMVEIAKALARKPRILILDEATSALAAADVTRIYGVLKRLRAEGLALVYISHRMHEIAELADECTVFCNGRSVASFAAGTRTDNEIVELMIGREYNAAFPPRTKRAPGDATPLLDVRHLCWTDRLNDISLRLSAGDVIGLGGLDGQGQRELLLALFGVLKGTTGEVRIDGRPVTITGPDVAKRDDIGMALIPEDRKTEGLMLPMSVRDNLSFAALGKLSRWGIVDRAAEREAVERIAQLLAVRSGGTDMPAASLSGGNQQKLVIGKWLLVAPRILLLNDPTRGIDVGTKQEMYQLLRNLADAGAAILFYSTDYDELIGCCDRVLVMYDGAILRELAGDEITEHALVSSALNIGAEVRSGKPLAGGLAVNGDWSYRLREHKGTLLAFAAFAVMFAIYATNHPAGLNANVATTAANKGVLLAIVAMAQTLVVLTSGIDLSVGMVMVLANCLASGIVVGTPLMTVAGVLGVLFVGCLCGAINGIIVIYGRLQPIVTTIATGAIYYGVALALRPVPGGDVNASLADALTGQLPGGVPASLAVLLALVAVVWLPFRRSAVGRAAYAVGSSEVAAFMSGVPIRRAKFVAYTLSGLLASVAGLFLTFITYTGEASAANGGAYTLFSIAAVVLGGVSLFGGSGSAVGAIFGALMFRTIGDLLFVFNVEPLWQPLFQGIVLFVAVCLGSARLLRVRNRLDLYG